MAGIFGTSANDSLTGTEQSDRIFGKTGNDTISGLGGNDWLFGEAGDDTLSGDDGNDSLFGGDGSDNLDGAQGNNFLFGGNGNDTISNRGADNSFLFGGNGDDSLFGGGGNDRIYGEDGNDNLIGFSGNDTLEGGAGNDVLDGTLVARGEGEIDTLAGGSGADTFSLRYTIAGAEAGPSYAFEGNNDYALITDFDKSQDAIQLAEFKFVDLGPSLESTKVEYSLGASPEGLPQGTGIYANNLGAQPDLIAILQGVSPDWVSLSQSYFQIT